MRSPFFARLVTKLFARPATRTARRLGMEQLEDRVVPTGSFGGRVWLDENANGVQDGTEPGVPNVVVTALDNEWHPCASDVTDAYGDYVVEGVPDDSYNSTYLLPEGSPYHFGHYGSGVQAIYYPTGVGGTIAIPVYEPPEVSVVALGEAVEGEVAGAFRFTRTGDLSTSLTVDYEVVTGPSNYATNGDDVVTLSGTVTIPAWSEFWDVPVEAWADNDYDPDETLNISVLASSRYTPGLLATARMAIEDTSFVVTTTADAVSIPGNRVSLREALNVANSIWRVTYRTISFNFPGTTGTITLGSTLPPVAKAIHIAGPADRGVTITGGVQHMRVLPSGDLKLTGLQFLDARSMDEGGAIFTQGELDITNCKFRGNQSATSGGAIAGSRSDTEEDGSITITDSDIIENTAELEGGGIFVDGIDLSLFETTISFNTAGTDGGGIASVSSPPLLPPGVPVPPRAGVNTIAITSCRIEWNVAGLNGGGVSVQFGHVGFLDTTVAFNGAGKGGGLYADLESEVTFLSGGANTFAYNGATESGKGIYLTGFSFITADPYYELLGGDDLVDTTV